MGANQSTCCLGPPSPSPAPAPPPAPSPRVPNIQFRVLIIGRANAGKTSILQRVCDTTESPEVYKLGPSGTRELVKLGPTEERGHHNIEDELIFTNHTGYVFHDSRGFEAGGAKELNDVQEFVSRKSRERRLKDRLHAIWYCIPTDNNRPSLDSKHFADICPDKNVPVIAVFTKFEQFKRNIKMKLNEQGRDLETHLDEEVESMFNEHYMAELGGSPPFICLERMHQPNKNCRGLIEVTANALSGGVVGLMLVAVQRDNLELSVKQAIKWTHRFLERATGGTETVIKICMMAFPSIWYYEDMTTEGEKEEEERREEERERRLFLLLEEFEELEREEEFLLLFELLLLRERFKSVFHKLESFYSDPFLRTSGNNADHAMIATVLILEYACIHFASRSHTSCEEVLDEARSQFVSSDTHDAANQLFPQSPGAYSTRQFTEFILEHRLR